MKRRIWRQRLIGLSKGRFLRSARPLKQPNSNTWTICRQRGLGLRIFKSSFLTSVLSMTSSVDWLKLLARYLAWLPSLPTNKDNKCLLTIAWTQSRYINNLSTGNICTTSKSLSGFVKINSMISWPAVSKRSLNRCKTDLARTQAVSILVAWT